MSILHRQSVGALERALSALSMLQVRESVLSIGLLHELICKQKHGTMLHSMTPRRVLAVQRCRLARVNVCGSWGCGRRKLEFEGCTPQRQTRRGRPLLDLLINVVNLPEANASIEQYQIWQHGGW